jgi:putative phosphonate metabolism protein
MADFPRYAIYYAAPQGSDLDRFGADHLGYDADSGDELPFPREATRIAPDWRQLTEAPRKYGFHATLKAPLSLVAGTAEADLVAACAAFASRPRPIPIIKPVVDSISDFIAIIPAERSIELERLAADCVREFDAFRPPLSIEERARRNPPNLTARQREYLDRWGYPYVLEEYRFHMTLTDRLDPGRRAPILGMLRRRFQEIKLESFLVESIALFCQADRTSRFRVVGRWPLST